MGNVEEIIFCDQLHLTLCVATLGLSSLCWCWEADTDTSPPEPRLEEREEGLQSGRLYLVISVSHHSSVYQLKMEER